MLTTVETLPLAFWNLSIFYTFGHHYFMLVWTLENKDVWGYIYAIHSGEVDKREGVTLVHGNKVAGQGKSRPESSYGCKGVGANGARASSVLGGGGLIKAV